MRPPAPRIKPEPTIALINVVFLMLIFFMVAGQLSPPVDPELELVNTRDLDGREPSNALVITANGELRFRGQPVDGPAPYLEEINDLTVARIMPDRAAPAVAVLTLSRELRAAGAKTVMIVTEKARE